MSQHQVAAPPVVPQLFCSVVLGPDAGAAARVTDVINGQTRYSFIYSSGSNANVVSPAVAAHGTRHPHITRFVGATIGGGMVCERVSGITLQFENGNQLVLDEAWTKEAVDLNVIAGGRLASQGYELQSITRGCTVTLDGTEIFVAPWIADIPIVKATLL
jgi:hypothetical protein